MPDQILELEAALKAAMQSGAIEWDGDVPLSVSPSIFPLRDGGMAGLLRGLAEELENGAGATMLQGLPVDRYTIPELSVLYLGMCGYIGNTVPQSSAGLRSKSRGYGLPIGHVKAEMRGKTPKDGKQVTLMIDVAPIIDVPPIVEEIMWLLLEGWASTMMGREENIRPVAPPAHATVTAPPPHHLD
jgi:hypothetical protein